MRICLNAHIELAEMQVFSVSINRKKKIQKELVMRKVGKKLIITLRIFFVYINWIKLKWLHVKRDHFESSYIYKSLDIIEYKHVHTL